MIVLASANFELRLIFIVSDAQPFAWLTPEFDPIEQFPVSFNSILWGNHCCCEMWPLFPLLPSLFVWPHYGSLLCALPILVEIIPPRPTQDIYLSTKHPWGISIIGIPKTSSTECLCVSPSKVSWYCLARFKQSGMDWNCPGWFENVWDGLGQNVQDGLIWFGVVWEYPGWSEMFLGRLRWSRMV